MKSKAKVISLMLSLILSAASIAGCSGGNEASESSEDISNASVVESEVVSKESFEQSTESSEESSEIIDDSEPTSETSSSKPGIDPAVEERSYSDEEKQQEQDTRIPDYKYCPYDETYAYRGTESKVIVLSDFKECPWFPQNTFVKEVIIPESVTTIPKGSLGGCKNLEKLVILNPDCEIEGSILPKDSLVNIYCYFRSDKTVPKLRLYNIGGCSKVFNALGSHYSGKNFDKYMHDLAEESYE